MEGKELIVMLILATIITACAGYSTQKAIDIYYGNNNETIIFQPERN